MKTLPLFDKTITTPIKSTVFADGMVVNANDLQAAMLYPLELIQVLIRAYFGCGIVCGLELKRQDAKETVSVEITAGVALDCHGFPLQLREKVTIDLTPDPCIKLEDKPTCVCIAISRATSQSAPRLGGNDDSGKAQYARQEEAVRVKAFALPNPEEQCPDWPKNLCAACEPNCQESGHAEPRNYCQCMTQCPECTDSCREEAWVLIGCVQMGTSGIEIKNSCRKYVKPIDCICRLMNKDTGTNPVPPSAPAEGTATVEEVLGAGTPAEG